GRGLGGGGPRGGGGGGGGGGGAERRGQAVRHRQPPEISVVDRFSGLVFSPVCHTIVTVAHLPDVQTLERPAETPAARVSKRRPRPRLRAIDGSPPAVADWASLFGDLARRPSPAPEADSPVEWRVHDRT